MALRQPLAGLILAKNSASTGQVSIYMRAVTIELQDQEIEEYAKLAMKLGVSVAQLLRSILRSTSTTDDQSYQEIKRDLLDRNDELYRRLA